jgi:hypothetical protein
MLLHTSVSELKMTKFQIIKLAGLPFLILLQLSEAQMVHAFKYDAP